MVVVVFLFINCTIVMNTLVFTQSQTKPAASYSHESDGGEKWHFHTNDFFYFILFFYDSVIRKSKED